MGLNQFHVSFRKLSRSQHTLCDFKFSNATLTKHDNQTAFVWRRFPFTLKQQKNMFCSKLALSVTCTNTPRLSADDCLQDAGMLQPGISYSRAAAHFGFHRDIFQKLQKHYHVSYIACDCLRGNWISEAGKMVNIMCNGSSHTWNVIFHVSIVQWWWRCWETETWVNRLYKRSRSARMSLYILCCTYLCLYMPSSWAFFVTIHDMISDKWPGLIGCGNIICDKWMYHIPCN